MLVLLLSPDTEQLWGDMDDTEEHIHAFGTSIHSFANAHHHYLKLY